MNSILEGFEKKRDKDDPITPLQEQYGFGADIPDDWVSDLSSKTVPERQGAP